MSQFDRTQLHARPLAKRSSKSAVEQIAIDPDSTPLPANGYDEIIATIAAEIIHARSHRASVVLAFGAHLIKNGLGLVLRRMIQDGFITHLATNGAGSIHDWEFAFLGRSEEDVRSNVQLGQFGLWEETGKYINLALLAGAAQRKGYGESISELIHSERLIIPDRDEIKRQILGLPGDLPPNKLSLGGLIDLLTAMECPDERIKIQPGEFRIPHPYRQYSFQAAAYSSTTPVTVHPGFGYDIIYTNPYNFGAAIGRTAEVDWLRFANSIANLEGGIYISIGSAIMSPMIFEKALSMARNVAHQNHKTINDFMIVVNDIQPAGGWKWGTGIEPPKDSPAYYLRFCKTFDRMGAREMHYLCLDNRVFLLNLFHHLKSVKNNLSQ